jgi:rSAM/selenodomain-associated transferase 1
MPDRSTLIVVFAKAPQPGRVKTRLAAGIGAQAAARLHARLVDRTLRTAIAAGCGPVELHGSPAHHAYLRAVARRHAIGLRSQRGGDIGRRMYEAFRQGLRRHDRMILVGSDCPALEAADVKAASRLLKGHQAVFAPAEDGGYPLIGLSRNSISLFEGIEWSTGTVMRETRSRLVRLGWRWSELRTLWDVDRPADLARLSASGLLGRRP